MRILLIGGSKSGKSRLAQEFCLRLDGERYYWATMEPADGEDRARIARHREERAGCGFITIEQGRNLSAQAVPPDAAVLFDSVTALLSNEMFSSGGIDQSAGERAGKELLETSRRCRHFVCVCDDLWRDGMDYDDATRYYCRALAQICRRCAEEFDTVCEVTGGLVRCWKGALPE